MGKWEYGGVYKKYDLENGKPYVFDDGSIIQVQDIIYGLPDFMRQADVIFVDPPWNQGNMTSFYTKADTANPHKIQSLYDTIFKYLEEINPKYAFMEIGKEYLAETIMDFKKIFKYVTFYNSGYYHSKDKFCYVVQGSQKRKNFKLDGMDEENIIKWICENIDYECIGDFCMGRGLVGLYSYMNGKRFVGTELNHKRLAVLIDRIEEYKEVTDGANECI